MGNSDEQIEKLPLDEIRTALTEQDHDRVGAIVTQLHPAELALLIESLPAAERWPVWEHLPSESSDGL